jgi:hypothetical protein
MCFRKSIVTRLLCLSFTIFLFSCVRNVIDPNLYNTKIDTWNGATTDELYRVYGYPHATVDLSEDTTLVMYSQESVGSHNDICKTTLNFKIMDDVIMDQYVSGSFCSNHDDWFIKENPNLTGEQQSHINQIEKSRGHKELLISFVCILVMIGAGVLVVMSK